MAVTEQIKGVATNASAYWEKQPPKRKKIYIVGAATIVGLAILLTVWMNINKGQFEVLYPGVTASESAEVYAELQTKGVEAKLNSNGEVMVPKAQWDTLVFQLAAEGFPKTAPAYGIFLDNIGPTTTEFEKQEIKKFQLQNRIQDTLTQIDGILGATVTINLPEQSDRVWEQEQSVASAAVLLTLEQSGEISPEKVSTIKKLVATTLPNGKVENVMVTDNATSIELDDDLKTDSNYNLDRLAFERDIQKNMEDNIKRLFAPSYGPEGVVAVATVVIDYDKMISESKELLPEDDGNGVIKNENESYVAGGGIPEGGIAGEENNTDLPGYVVDGDATGDDIINYDRNTEYETSYIKTQIERGEAPIKMATISVVVDEDNLTTEKRENLIDLISKAVNIQPEDISVSSMDLKSEPVIDDNTGGVPFYKNTQFMMAFGVVIGLLILILIVLLLVKSKIRKKKQKEQEEQEELLRLEQEAAMSETQRAEEEIDLHKSKLRDGAEAQKIQESSMTAEIRSFTEENPEMAAVLIRTLLQEDDKHE